jgi:hypothetical protein
VESDYVGLLANAKEIYDKGFADGKDRGYQEGRHLRMKEVEGFFYNKGRAEIINQLNYRRAMKYIPVTPLEALGVLIVAFGIGVYVGVVW